MSVRRRGGSGSPNDHKVREAFHERLSVMGLPLKIENDTTWESATEPNISIVKFLGEQFKVAAFVQCGKREVLK